MATRYSLGEAVQNRLSGGKGKAATWADIREIYTAIAQVANQLLKLDYFKVTLDAGDTAPDGLAVATYTNIPVVPYQNTAKLTLPASYIRLPRGLGVRYVGPQVPPDGLNLITAQYIPIPSGMGIMLNGQPMISDLLGQIAYEVDGLDVIFLSDITAPPNNVTSCMVKLVVLDMSRYSDYDILPLPADLEAACIEQVYQMFAQEPGPVKNDDPQALNKPQR